VFVAGLGSHSSGQGAPENLSTAFHAAELGYAPGDVVDFSYLGARHPKAYKASDTVRDLRDDAADLRALLDQIAHDNPGVHVDVIAHSQGGLIAREALSAAYDGVGHALPIVDHLVTLGTPHHGADAATALAWLRWSAEGRAIRRIAKMVHRPVDLAGPGVGQLAETSDFIRNLNDTPLRDGIAYTSIASAHDLTVPAVRARLRGANNVLVDGGNALKSHTSLHESPEARRELALALADAPATCQSIATTTARAFTGGGIAEFEDAVGGGAAAMGAGH
jgi:hypothetical protein